MLFHSKVLLCRDEMRDEISDYETETYSGTELFDSEAETETCDETDSVDSGAETTKVVNIFFI